jgi:hypothetical protein
MFGGREAARLIFGIILKWLRPRSYNSPAHASISPVGVNDLGALPNVVADHRDVSDV